jgi:hypothetical protein
MNRAVRCHHLFVFPPSYKFPRSCPCTRPIIGAKPFRLLSLQRWFMALWQPLTKETAFLGQSFHPLKGGTDMRSQGKPACCFPVVLEELFGHFVLRQLFEILFNLFQQHGLGMLCRPERIIIINLFFLIQGQVLLYTLHVVCIIFFLRPGRFRQGTDAGE